MSEVLYGVLTCVCGSTLTALGLILQKLAHRRCSSAGTPYYRHPWWLIGFLVFVFAQVINIVAMAHAPQMVLSCLGSWSLVCNAIFARVILGEEVGRTQAAAVLGLVGAVLVIVLNAPQAPNDKASTSAATLVADFQRPSFEVLTALLLSSTLLLRAAAEGYQCTASKGSKEIAAAVPQPLLGPLSWAAASAVAGSYSALLFKCIAELVATSTSTAKATPFPPSPWQHALAEPDQARPLSTLFCWQSLAIVTGALLLAPAQVHLLNRALENGEAVIVVPAYFALGMIAQLLTGAVFFQELRDFDSTGRVVGFTIGVCLSLVFVVVMAKASNEPQCQLGTEADTPACSVQDVEQPQAATGNTAGAEAPAPPSMKPVSPSPGSASLLLPLLDTSPASTSTRCYSSPLLTVTRHLSEPLLEGRTGLSSDGSSRRHRHVLTGLVSVSPVHIL